MNKVYFAICLHFHQPVGNFQKVLDRAFENCYKPFLDIFEKYPDLKMTFHFSGCLLDYLEENHPDYLDRIAVMVKRGQVEMFGGGYYEPIFTAIPEKDRVGQIEMMSDYLRKRFGKRPDGMWIPERVWVPELIPYFTKAKIRYSILDDEHFIKAGLKTEDLHGYFTAVYKDDSMSIFPSSKQLRYTIPFKMPNETIEYFRKALAEKKTQLFTYGDDGEKFGEWPGTHDWVYKSEWLRKFLDELSANKDWLETVTLKEAMKLVKPRREVNIPEASYQEMMEWSDGSWMNFLKKYPETNQMVRKMHYVSAKIHGVTKSQSHKVTSEAFRELYKGQCNCAYWHGVFGGIYLYHLRSAIYEHLIKAEKIVWSQGHKVTKSQGEIKEIDFYKDGTKSFVIENEKISVLIDPARGGVIRELDDRDLSVNLINSISRHEEAYHKKILEKLRKGQAEGGVHTIHEDVKEMDPGLQNEFFYDNHVRSCLVDHFIEKDTTIEEFMNCKFTEKGDFVNAPYEAEAQKNKIILSRKGRAFSITKEIALKGKKELEISYIIKNIGKSAADIVFGSEFNFTMPYLNSDIYSYSADEKFLNGLNEAGAVQGPSVFSIKDSSGKSGIALKFSKKPDSVWYFPVRTVSQSERAYELNYQCSCVFPHWRLHLVPLVDTRVILLLST